MTRNFVKFIALFCAITTVGIAQKPLAEKDSLAIVKLLVEQQHAWNRGDIPAFMEGYHKSENLTFTGSNGVVTGWNATLQRYQNSYPDKSHMGELRFTFLKSYEAGPRTALFIGRFELLRDMGNASGYFTLVLRKFSNGWRIISDHTSASDVHSTP